jgi:serine/threonine-protein kinase HipA
MPTHVLQVNMHGLPNGLGVPVGHVLFDGQRDAYDFRYADSWLARHDAFPLSPHIPLSDPNESVSIKPGAVQRFLQNLLLEGRALDVVSIAHQVSKDNVFGMMALLGKEPAGALSFKLAGAESSEPAEGEPQNIRRLISDEELSMRIAQREYIPLPVWDGKVRLSVAGYQDKLQVLVEGDQLSLADGCLASTHILKPEPRSPVSPCMVANEHFCMTLASQMGLPVAPVLIRRIPEPILLIKRFDRQVVCAPIVNIADTAQNPSALIGQTTAVSRLHVIDGCQALDLPAAFKYERQFGHGRDVQHIRDGASFEKLLTALAFDNPILARVTILRWALLQLLLGNSDAHGKNISFFMRGNTLMPAPFYDLVSVNVYGEHVEEEMAMGFGDAFLPKEVSAFDLADFANRCAIPTSLLIRELSHLSAKAKSMAPVLAESECYVGQEREWVRTIAQYVTEQADRLLKMAPEVRKVDPKLL